MAKALVMFKQKDESDSDDSIDGNHNKWNDNGRNSVRELAKLNWTEEK